MGEKPNQNKKFFLIKISAGLFIYYAIHFLNTNGSNLPIPSILFNMIIILGILLFLFHEKYFIEERNDIQENLDKYFKKK